MNEPVASNEAELAWAFPSVEPGAKPLGGRILVQLRRTKKKTTGAGILLIEETKETEKWNNMVAKVIAIGPLAFKHRDTMQAWPEGEQSRRTAKIKSLDPGLRRGDESLPTAMPESRHKTRRQWRSRAGSRFPLLQRRAEPADGGNCRVDV